MNDMPMPSATTALMATAMMVAMMLPSLAAALWRYDRGLRAMHVPRAGQRATLFAVGYLGVWSAIALMLVALNDRLCSMQQLAASSASWATALVILAAGALQCSRWKARRLARCSEAPEPAVGSSKDMMAWRRGCRFGLECAASCAPPMAVLLVAGLMNERMMMVVTVAITAERVAPHGSRVARLTGALTIAAGTSMCLRAMWQA